MEDITNVLNILSICFAILFYYLFFKMLTSIKDRTSKITIFLPFLIIALIWLTSSLIIGVVTPTRWSLELKQIFCMFSDLILYSAAIFITYSLIKKIKFQSLKLPESLDYTDVKSYITKNIIDKLNWGGDKKGKNYIIDALLIGFFHQGKGELEHTKVIYPELKEKYGGNANRNIGYALDIAWENTNEEILKEVYPSAVKSKRPSPGEFLKYLIDDLKENLPRIL